MRNELIDLYKLACANPQDKDIVLAYQSARDRIGPQIAIHEAIDNDVLRAHLEHAESHVKCQTEENYLLADCMCLEYHENLAIRARVARLEEALPDPHRLEILAAWFDLNFEDDRNPEVQNDLREWAKKIRRALEEK